MILNKIFLITYFCYIATLIFPRIVEKYEIYMKKCIIPHQEMLTKTLF